MQGLHEDNSESGQFLCLSSKIMSIPPLCDASPHRSESKPVDPTSRSAVSIDLPRVGRVLDASAASESAQLPGQDAPFSKASLSPPHQDTGLSSERITAFSKMVVPLDIDVPKILLNAGILSYVMFTAKMLWRLSVMFRSQPHGLAVGFLLPTVATYAFVWRYSLGKFDATKPGIPQAAVDVTILAVISCAGDWGAMAFLAYTFGTKYLTAST
ncbi:hypothetical protein F5880DRAFT_1511110 [Lentinula raphanica]|nr:hypothetical protein F5880DRAFT_1511110 [Lentinula raphanica]